MSAYGPLANYYDILTEDVDYRGLYDYLQGHFARAGIQPRSLLDMACDIYRQMETFEGIDVAQYEDYAAAENSESDHR